MKKPHTIACCLVLLLTTVKAQRATLCVTNPSDYQREEVVEADLATIRTLLQTDDSEQLVVRNSAGQEQTYQLAHNGKLLVYVTVRPHSTAELTVVDSQSMAGPTRVIIRMLVITRENRGTKSPATTLGVIFLKSFSIQDSR